MSKIKIKLRKNLLYLLAYYFAWIINEALKILLVYYCLFYQPDLYLILITVGKIFGGLIIFIYQNHHIKNQKQIQFFEVNLSILTTNENKKRVKDGKTKILLLMLFASFFYVLKFIIHSLFIFPFHFSPSIELRFSSMQTVSAALISTYALGFEMKRHHKFSLINISIFLFLSLIIEIIYNLDDKHLGSPISTNLLLFFLNICETFSNCIEKYLVDVNYINPFLILMIEGIIEFIISLIFILSFEINFITNLKNAFKNQTKEKYILLIIFLVFYFIVSVINNIYKIYCNVIYTPMARSLINYLLNPLFYIFYFLMLGDFKQKIHYFIISEIISLILSFFGCVYNEYIIIFCCGLDNETKDSIIKRAGCSSNTPKSGSRILNDNISDDGIMHTNSLITIDSYNLILK